MKGQVSTELLVIVGFVLLVFIPLLVMVYFKANEANQQIASYHAELAVFRLAYLVNSIGSLGTDTSVTTDVFIPKNTKELRTESSGNGGEIILQLDTPEGQNDVVEVVRYPIANVGTLADSTTAGGWVRVKISSHYYGGQPMMILERVSG